MAKGYQYPLMERWGRKEVFYLTTHSTRLYGVRHMVKDHRQDNTYHGLCYPSRGSLAGTRKSSMGPPNEVSIRLPIAP